MFRCIIISPDRVLAAELKHHILQTGRLAISRILPEYPSELELSRVVKTYMPQTIFVSTESVGSVVAIAGLLETILPGAQVVAAGRESDTAVLMTLMRAGVREFVASPFESDALNACISRVEDNLRRRPVAASESTELVYSFLPAKPGSGASTLAVNASLAAASQQPGKSLLCDFDLNSGIVQFLLKLEMQYTVLDAAERANNMDENVWSQLVAKTRGVEVLQSGVLNPDVRLQSQQLQDMLGFARRNYKIVSFDLSGNLEKYSLELMHASRRVFLVCTPEVCSLHLAREKMRYLRSVHLGDRVSILLNRYHPSRDVKQSEVEALVDAPVLMSFQNDYKRIRKAVNQGDRVDPFSELGKQVSALASYMMDEANAPAAIQRRKFIEYFTIAPNHTF
jgi:pilus assembly protein CpaE